MKEIIINIDKNWDREELRKKIGFVSEDIINFLFEQDKIIISVTDDENIENIKRKVINIAEKTLINADMEVRYDSSDCGNSYFDCDKFTSVINLKNGSIILKNQSLFLFKLFNEYFLNIVNTAINDYEEREYPVMLSIDQYQKTGYLKNSPQYAIFCSTVCENISELENIDNSIKSQNVEKYLKYPQYALSPSACFHTYIELENVVLDGPKAFTFVQRVFRNEGRFNINTFARLRDYHVREIVLVGDWNYVRTKRERLIEGTITLLKNLGLIGDITVASDPFIMPKMQKFKKIQVYEKSKYELHLNDSKKHKISVASFNIHGTAFTHPFNIGIKDVDQTITGCIGYGIERWVLAFLCQYGEEINNWPIEVKERYIHERCEKNSL